MCLRLPTVKSLVTGVYRYEKPLRSFDNSSSLVVRRGGFELGLSHESMCIWMLARYGSESSLYVRLCFPKHIYVYPEPIPREQPDRRLSLESPQSTCKFVCSESIVSLL